MPNVCDYCRGPIVGSPMPGRPSPERPTASYCCYGCLSLGESSSHRSNGSGIRLDGAIIRLGIGILLAGQSMIFGMAINVEENSPRMVKLAVQGAILGGTLIVMALLGWPLLRGTLTELRRGRITIEALFLLTMTGALGASLQSLLTGNGPVYFEVISILLVVSTLGKMIGARSRARAIASASEWGFELSTCRLTNGQVVNVSQIAQGDSIEVRAGETIAVDGVILAGVGFVSEAAVNGEPFAVVKRPGDKVFAGSMSRDGLFRIEATTAGTNRQIDQLIKAVEDARRRPISLQARADRMSRVFVPLILFIACATFAVWAQISGWRVGLFNAMSVLLVACPCALGLATPIIIWSTLNQLAQRGLVVRSGDAIERLAQVECVAFDKTGTLTDDRFGIVDIATLGDDEDRARVLRWLSLVESHSNHPIARPFAQLSRARINDSQPTIVEHRTIPGCGIEAELDDRGKRHLLRVGRSGWLASSTSAEAETLLNRLVAKSGHRIDFAIDGKLAAIAIVNERLRDSASETIDELSAMGLPVRVLTGDAPERAGSLGLTNAEGHLLPDDKMQRIAESDARVLMVGDGLNDASALAAAHVGIALASGTDLANEAATATLYNGDLRTIPWAVALSRNAIQAVRYNLIRATAYNLVGVGLAAFGILHPIAAALLMAVSSLLLAWSSVRINAESCAMAHSNSRAADRTNLMPAAIHALAFSAQAVCIGLLLGLNPTASIALLGFFVAVAILGAYVWLQSRWLPHWFDMAFGMLTLGNLSMLIGWWADNNFTALSGTDSCPCAQTARGVLSGFWMWLGMLMGANIAMMCLLHCPRRDEPGHRTAMFTGGNVGMMAGMLAGGWAVGVLETQTITLSAILSMVGMTAGMIMGMLAGTAVAQWMIAMLKRQSVDRIQETSKVPHRSDAVEV